MGEIIKINGDELTPVEGQKDLMEITEGLLLDVRSSIESKKTMSVPIGELSTLGAGVASLVPAINTVTTTTTMATDGLFTIANKVAGDTLKMAKNGNAWGAMKTAAGGSKMVQLAEAGPLTATSQAVAAINPATMMMAVALYSIEKQLGEIAETQKQILAFLEIKDEANVEGDLETLTELINNYKHNWDNEMYVQNSHKMVMDIKRTARSNMLTYQKKVAELVSSKKLLVAQGQVKSALSELEKRFKYYRLSLYTYSLASMMEIMLGGNYKEEYISGIKDEIVKLSGNYRELFEKSSIYLEKLGESAVEANVLKGIGTAGKAVGKFIGSIPLVKEGPVDEFLQDSGSHLKKNAIGMEKKAVHQFASLNNSGTHVFVDKMNDMIQIYNHTERICFDDKDFFKIDHPEKTKVKFNMNAGDVNLRAWDYLINGEEDPDWIQMNSWKTKQANNNLNRAEYLMALCVSGCNIGLVVRHFGMIFGK